MSIRQPRYSKGEFARRADAIYEKAIRSKVEPAEIGKFIAFDIETGEYEVDEDDFTATERLITRLPDAQMWLTRVGERCAHGIGAASGDLPKL